jgi:hypothetical protein
MKIHRRYFFLEAVYLFYISSATEIIEVETVA